MTEPTTEPLKQNWMPKIDGKSFRCPDCGANVFSKPKPDTDPLLFECNGCGTWWRGEK